MSAPATRQSLPIASDLGKNIDYELFMDCVHCGLCLGSCPTYVETGNENDSPRGRIYLWRAIADGRAPFSPEAEKHMNGCLECMACETACPSGVQYRHVIHSFKNDQARTRGPAPMLGWLQRAMLFGLTPHRSRMAWALFPVKLMQRIGLGWAVRLSGYLMPGFLRRMQEIVPDLAPYHNLPEFLPAIGPKRATVGLLLGCAADAFHPQINLATARVLQHNGCDVHIPRSQACCGALHKHAGLDDDAARLAAGNCDSFAAVPGGLAGLDAIISNAGGCSPVLKDYGHILEGHDAAGPGAVFGGKVRDIHEFLAELGPVKPRHKVALKATYHDACGLAHAQKIRSAPRQVLAMVDGLSLAPLAENEHCCGAAGSYNITQPEMSAALGQRKSGNIAATGASAALTGNVGCLLQIDRHMRDRSPRVWVGHPVQILDAAYTGEKPFGLDVAIS
ncbi:MAG: (Fe-S)-binding protein [Planctomycetes bacterium]|jgi:glycolate oxidase iron-sulfur subunit|nr:(Fe-S)-binding protein [Planctomycetota bacterium]